jgi:Flp pilus assembly protein TadG
MNTTTSDKNIVCRSTGRLLRNRSGGAVLELAITLSLLMTLTFGSIEFGDAFFKKNTLQGAAREGARTAITSGATNTTVEAAVQAVMNAAGITGMGTTYTVAITDTADTNVTVNSVAAGTAIKVTVYAEWSKIGLRPLGILGATKRINGVAVMRKES